MRAAPQMAKLVGPKTHGLPCYELGQKFVFFWYPTTLHGLNVPLHVQ